MNPFSSDSLLIRSYLKSDQDVLWALHKESLGPTGSDAGDKHYSDLLDVDNAFLRAGGDFVVGYLETELVAMGGLALTAPGRAEIKRMRVHPDYQRRGFGEAILRALEQSARNRGFDVLHLETTVVQTAANALHLRHGYEEAGRARTLGFDVIRYVKKL